jgi:hypothetical protein
MSSRESQSSQGSLIRSTAAVLSLVHPQVELNFASSVNHHSTKALERLDRLSLFFVHSSHRDAVAISSQVKAEVLEAHLAFEDDDDGYGPSMSAPNTKTELMHLSMGYDSFVEGSPFDSEECVILALSGRLLKLQLVDFLTMAPTFHPRVRTQHYLVFVLLT